VGLPYANPTNSGQWAQDLLTQLGDPLSASNIGYLEAWIPHESPSGFGYNPIGTEQTTPTSIHAPGNAATVQAYQSWADGLAATVKTFTGWAGNKNLIADLQKGNASYAQLAADQATSSWSTGGEKTIAAPGTSTPFTYGGSYGLIYGAKGVASAPGDSTAAAPAAAPASRGVTGDIWYTITHPYQIGHQAGASLEKSGGPGAQLNAVTGGITSGIFAPVAKWIEHGAADVTFVVFGLVLVVVGLSVAFKDTQAGGDALGAAKVAAS
jgi:hypothetical protein